MFSVRRHLQLIIFRTSSVSRNLGEERKTTRTRKEKKKKKRTNRQTDKTRPRASEVSRGGLDRQTVKETLLAAQIHPLDVKESSSPLLQQLKVATTLLSNPGLNLAKKEITERTRFGEIFKLHRRNLCIKK